MARDRRDSTARMRTGGAARALHKRSASTKEIQMTKPLQSIESNELARVTGGNLLKGAKKVIEIAGGLLRAGEGSGRLPEIKHPKPLERPGIIDTRPPPQPPKLPDGVKVPEWP